MSNNNNQEAKLNLNIGAKAFVPKSMNTNNNMGGGMNMNMGYQGGYNPYYNPQMMNNNMGMNNMNNNYMNYNQMNYVNQGYQQQQGQQPNLNQNQNNQKFENKKKEEPKKIITNPNFNNQNDKKPNPNQNKNQQQNNNNAKKEVKKDTTKKPTQPVKKEEKKEEKKEKPKEVNENDIDKDLDNLDIKDEEVVLVEDSKEGKMIEVDETKQPVSIVFIGHVDHGKSTIAGNILISTGMVDERTLEKYQKEAKSKGRDSWYIAYAMDINEDERDKGKTIEIGKAHFRTENKRFTILDAPGHSGYLPNMLQGACQADFAGLVISAKAGEFEAGFEKSGSTREHVLLAKSLGVSKLIVLVNKMDEESVKWSESRFNQIRSDLSEFLKKVGYNVETDVQFVPISGLFGDNLKEKLNSHKCPWYNGSTLLEILDKLEPPKRDPNGPLRMTILDRYKEGGMHVMGKIESGRLKYGDSYVIMPSKANIEVNWIFNSEDEGVPYALPGESVRVSFL